MSELLIDGMPESVIVDGEEYTIDSSFRTALQVITAWEAQDLTQVDKEQITLELLYEDAIPPNRRAAIDMAVFFLDCGEESKDKRQTAEEFGRLYAFGEDAKFIYSAIRMTYGIDLALADLHWWGFCYLLQDLNSDCYFQRMIYLRQQRQKGKLTKEEREEWRKNEHILLLPEYRDPEAEAASNAFLEKYHAALQRKAEE